ncbi:MAG: cellulose synthase operon protein YhjQ/BcsQ [Pirellula sp.]
MYPFKAVLIGQNESILPALRRELSNQNIEIEHEFPNVLSTVENLSLHHDENRLFLCQMDAEHQGDFLRRLSGAFIGRPIIALIEGDMNSAAVVHAMRDGAAQVVLLPMDIDDFRQALSMVAMQFGHASGTSRVIALTGAHGGVGTTTLAVNMGYELAQTYQVETIVAELSFNYGVLASYLTIEPHFNTLELLQYGQEIDVYLTKKALVPFGDRLSILAGPSRAVKSLSVNPATISHLIDSLRQLAQVVILDVPSTLDEAQLTALNSADEVVLVADQTVPSLQLTGEALRLGIKAHSPWVVINRFDPQIQGLDEGRIKKVLSIDKLRTIAIDHEAVLSSVNCGQPLRFCFPKSKALADINALTQDLLQVDQTVNTPQGFFGLLRNFGHSLGVC